MLGSRAVKNVVGGRRGILIADSKSMEAVKSLVRVFLQHCTSTTPARRLTLLRHRSLAYQFSGVRIHQSIHQKIS